MFTSSTSHEQVSPLSQPSAPRRKRSVRFQNEAGGAQVDGPFEHSEETSRDSRSSWSQRLSDQFDSIAAKMNAALDTPGSNTIVHRPISKQRPALPYMNADNTPSPQRTAEADTLSLSPSTVSSFSPTSKTMWSSPASTASTAATAWSPPGSTGSRHRATPEDHPIQNKSASVGAIEENALPPIQEDGGSYLMIPVQEAPIEAKPSITTVENVAAAKVYFETHFGKVLMDPASPRSLRRKRFEHKMADLGFSHDERIAARHR